MLRKIIICFCIFSTLVPGVAVAAELYPSDIQYIDTDGKKEIHKIYELEAGENPDMIPKASFEQDGYEYQLKDIVKTAIPELETKEVTEPVTLESPSNKMEDILPLMPPTKVVETEDGFSGILNLDISTLKIESKGTGTSSYTVTAVRTYPNLAGADLQYIPKTTVENGKTLQFSSVDWKSDNTANVDGYAIADRYTAVVTYSGTATRSYSKGYIVTVEYKGTAAKTSDDITQYTAIFCGTYGRQSILSGTEQYFIFLLGGAVLVLILCAGYRILKKRGAKKHDEIDEANPYEASVQNDTDFSSDDDDVFPGVRP